MGFFRHAFQKLKNTVFGAPPESDRGFARITSADSKVEPGDERLDIGPAKAWYIRRLFYRSVFTKKLTPSRAREVRSVFRRLRPEQRAIALARGWNRGLDI